MGRDRGTVVFCKIDFVYDFFKWIKIAAYRLINKIVAGGK